MDLEDLLGGLGNLDLGDMKDAISSLWENKDRIYGAVDWLADNKDKLLGLLDHLPGYLDAAGEGIAAAGHAAHAASGFLSSANGDSPVSDLANVAAVALDRCVHELANVVDMFDDFPGLGGVAKRIGGIATDVGAVSGQLRGLVTNLEEVGSGLGNVGEKLMNSGQTLATVGVGLRGGASKFADLPKPQAAGTGLGLAALSHQLSGSADSTAKKATKPATAKKAAPKKAAPKKAPAKKSPPKN